MNMIRLHTIVTLLLILLVFPAVSFALTADDMLKLKKAGIPEDIIVEMVQSGYQDADKVLKLKENGFTDRSIMAIVKGEAKNNQGKERITFKTAGKAKIMWYLVQRGKAVLQNSKTVDRATVYIVDDASIKIEWMEKKGLGLLDELTIKAFPPPFYWVLNKDDMLAPGTEDYSVMLQSTINHKGKPDSDGYHYWEIYLSPQDPKIADHIKQILLSLK